MKLYIKICIAEKNYFFPMPGEAIIIGRSKDCEIPVHDNFCSNYHCTLIVEGERLIIKDLDSKNGTFLNGHKIDQENIYRGDKVQFGRIELSIDELHTPLLVLEKFNPPPRRVESIPYYDPSEITKNHIKLRNFALQVNESPEADPSAKSALKPTALSFAQKPQIKDSLLQKVIKLLLKKP